MTVIEFVADWKKAQTPPPRREPDERDTVLRQALESLESQKAYIEANEPGLVTTVPVIADIKEILND